MLSEQAVLEAADPVEVHADLGLRHHGTNARAFEAPDHLTDLEVILLSYPCRMDEVCLEIGHDLRVETRDPMVVYRANDPVDGQAQLIRTPIHQTPAHVSRDLQRSEGRHR